jgi:transposase
MIDLELEAKILRLFLVEKWLKGTIASQLGVHHSTVERVLNKAGVPRPEPGIRPSVADPYLPFIRKTLEKYPRLRASRLYQMVKARGYPGQPDHFRSIVAQHRPRPVAEAFLRLRTLIGEQAQVDWAHFGKVTIGRAMRPLMAFVMVLAWSRQIFLRFYLNCQMANFLRGHVDAYAFFGGVARENLYDNLRSAVLERHGDAIRFHPKLLELARHYHFAPHPVAVARGNEKGRVERAIRYARDSFFAARKWKDLDDLNAQALEWCQGIAGDRKCPEDPAITVREAFARERGRLLPLPNNPLPTDERVEVVVRKTPYVRFDLNDYSIPHDRIQRTLTVVASLTAVRVLEGLDIVATHARSFDRGQVIEESAHVSALVEEKQNARKRRGMDHLHHAAPSSQRLLEAIAERGGNLGNVTANLLRLCDAYGSLALEAAIALALERGAPNLHAIRVALDQQRRQIGQPPPVAVALPDDPRVRNLVVRPHALESYDALHNPNTQEDSDAHESTRRRSR